MFFEKHLGQFEEGKAPGPDLDVGHHAHFHQELGQVLGSPLGPPLDDLLGPQPLTYIADGLPT